jgi:hypothetical protein
MPEKERWANSIIMINLRKILAASSLALGIGATAAPTTAQYYYYVPSQNYEQGYATSPETYTTPGGWGERGSNGWTYHGGGLDLGYGSNGCIYASGWSNC